MSNLLMALASVTSTPPPDSAVDTAWAALNLAFRFDRLSMSVSALVLFVGVAVVRFARRYLQGDPQRARGLAWMGLTLTCVLVLVLANHLLLLWSAWVGTSLSLHRLLLYFPGRPGAVFAARKKFVVSRLADLFLLLGLLVLYRHYGTLQIDALFASVAARDVSAAPGACLLLAFGAALKSAQFPFHSWLPDTMEAPTPVSALMHAGVINAGGYLILRLYPLFEHAPVARVVLTLFGVASAGFGALVMSTQPSVKRALAFSTIAQMGFLFLQCGLGAPGLAWLHLLAHAVYKAHAFLHAGSTLDAPPRAVIPLKTSAIVAGLSVAAVLVAGKSFILHRISAASSTTDEVLNIVLGLALAYGLARAGSSGVPRRLLFAILGAAAAFTAVNLSLHLATRHAFGSVGEVSVSPALAGLVIIAFAGLYLAQILLWRADRARWGRALYVHAVNGFYLSTYANRGLNRLWPRSLLG